MARPQIASHKFDGSLLDRSTWRGGQICQICNHPRYEHEADSNGQDYRYSSWSVSRAIREEISNWLETMRIARIENDSERERVARAALETLFRVHNSGLGRYAIESTGTRLSEIDAY